MQEHGPVKNIHLDAPVNHQLNLHCHACSILLSSAVCWAGGAPRRSLGGVGPPFKPLEQHARALCASGFGNFHPFPNRSRYCVHVNAVNDFHLSLHSSE